MTLLRKVCPPVLSGERVRFRHTIKFAFWFYLEMVSYYGKAKENIFKM